MQKQSLQLEPQPGASAPEVESEAPASDAVAADRAREHYADVISDLLNEAVKSKTLPAFANVVAFNLAWLIVEYGAVATGHVLERLGTHITYFVDLNRAVKEAEAARKSGIKPN